MAWVAFSSARPTPRNNPRIIRLPGQRGQHLSRHRRQRDRACASLGIAQPDFVMLEVDILPAQRQNFIASATGC